MAKPVGRYLTNAVWLVAPLLVGLWLGTTVAVATSCLVNAGHVIEGIAVCIGLLGLIAVIGRFSPDGARPNMNAKAENLALGGGQTFGGCQTPPEGFGGL